MNRITGILALALAAALTPRAGFAASDLLAPSDAARMWLPVEGKSRLYYRLDAGKHTTLAVTGPAEIKLIVRAIVDAPGSTPVVFSVQVSEAAGVVRTFDAEALPDGPKWKGQSTVATRSASFRIRVADGEHSLRVAFRSSMAKAAGIRYLRSDSGEPQVSLRATAMRESVTIVSKERALEYYVADAGVPVKATVVGPTRLRVTSRLIFPPAARGQVDYTLKIERDGQPLPDATFAATKSPVTECESHADWIVARGQSSFVEIPGGEHVVSFRLSNHDAPGVALRLSIPRKDVSHVN